MEQPSQELQLAQEELAKAADDVASGLFGHAIKHYRKRGRTLKKAMHRA
jgi:hypothetical protein